jgi:hypothetical protein
MNTPEQMTREEWIDRYAKRIMDRAGWSAEEARRAAEVGADEYERYERAANNALVWGSPTSPEDDADDEMSYWENDGEN